MPIEAQPKEETMSQPIHNKQSILPLALALAMAATACTHRAPMRITPISSAACSVDSAPGQDGAAPSDECTMVESEYPPHRGRRFSWGKALVLGMLLPSLLVVNVAAGMD
jgi:hypothetical protein